MPLGRPPPLTGLPLSLSALGRPSPLTGLPLSLSALVESKTPVANMNCVKTLIVTINCVKELKAWGGGGTCTI
jgi:hypothetical protein